MKTFSAILCLMTLSGLPLRAGSIGQELDKSLGKLQHALGWDSLNLKVLEANEGGQPLLERDVNAENTVERVTSYHPGGRKEGQRLTVVSRSGKQLLYEKRSAWDSSGDIAHRYLQDSSFDTRGGQTKGSLSEEDYEYGRLTKERLQAYSPGSGANQTYFLQTVTYYDDGDMKERITEKPLENVKERETWGETKGAEGRSWATSKWAAFKGAWD
jgi:hypothetical protein